jgi:hypothetical protein
MSPPNLDRPVIGSCLAGYAAWMLDPRTAEEHGPEALAGAERAGAERASADWVESGLTMFAFAGRANSRQDVPSLHRDAIAIPIAAAWGRERLDAALAAVAPLTPGEAATRGLALLSAVRA